MYCTCIKECLAPRVVVERITCRETTSLALYLKSGRGETVPLNRIACTCLVKSDRTLSLYCKLACVDRGRWCGRTISIVQSALTACVV